MYLKHDFETEKLCHAFEMLNNIYHLNIQLRAIYCSLHGQPYTLITVANLFWAYLRALILSLSQFSHGLQQIHFVLLCQILVKTEYVYCTPTKLKAQLLSFTSLLKLSLYICIYYSLVF